IWISNDTDAAEQHLGAATAIDDSNGRAYAERAALRLRLADTARARSDAQRAIELDPQAPDGYIVAGGCAELDGDFDEADQAYGSAVANMTVQRLTFRARPTIVQGSGRFLLRVAERLAQRWRTGEALSVLDRAMAIGILGDRNFPDAAAWALRAEILQSTNA